MSVLIIDDHPFIHEVMVAVVHRALGEVAVYWERQIETALDAAAGLADLQLVLLDFGLPGCNGVDAVRRLLGRVPSVPVLAFSALQRRQAIVPALKAGAAGFLPTASSHKVMIAAMRLVSVGGRYVPPEILQDESDAVLAERRDFRIGVALELTQRQRDVLRLLLQGYANQRIASELGITESTVKQHARAVFDALGVSTRAQLIASAARRNIGAN